MLKDKVIILSIILVLTLVILVPILFSFKINDLPNRLQPGLGATERIYKDVVLSQKFTSNKNNLSGIGLSIKNPIYRNKKDLTLEVKDENSGILRKTVVNGSNLEDGSLVTLSFEPINDSKDKNLSFELSAPDTENNEALEVFYAKDLPQGDQILKLNGNDNNTSLAYVTYYKQQNPIFSTIEIYKSVIQRLFNDFGFFIFYTLLIIVIIFLLIRSRKLN